MAARPGPYPPFMSQSPTNKVTAPAARLTVSAAFGNSAATMRQPSNGLAGMRLNPVSTKPVPANNSRNALPYQFPRKDSQTAGQWPCRRRQKFLPSCQTQSPVVHAKSCHIHPDAPDPGAEYPQRRSVTQLVDDNAPKQYCQNLQVPEKIQQRQQKNPARADIKLYPALQKKNSGLV